MLHFIMFWSPHNTEVWAGTDFHTMYIAKQFTLVCDQIHFTALAGSEVKPPEISKNKIFRLCEVTLNDTVGYLTKCSLWKGEGKRKRLKKG